jgi:hypothetical protein
VVYLSGYIGVLRSGKIHSKEFEIRELKYVADRKRSVEYIWSFVQPRTMSNILADIREGDGAAKKAT